MYPIQTYNFFVLSSLLNSVFSFSMHSCINKYAVLLIEKVFKIKLLRNWMSWWEAGRWTEATATETRNRKEWAGYSECSGKWESKESLWQRNTKRTTENVRRMERLLQKRGKYPSFLKYLFVCTYSFVLFILTVSMFPLEN